jgi:hypothetical protein
MGHGQDDHVVFEHQIGHGEREIRQQEAADGRCVVHSRPHGPGIGMLVNGVERPEDSGREDGTQPGLLSFVPLGGCGKLRVGFWVEAERHAACLSLLAKTLEALVHLASGLFGADELHLATDDLPGSALEFPGPLGFGIRLRSSRIKAEQ